MATLTDCSTWKHCPKCRRDLPRRTFGVARNRHDGLSGWCRGCKAELQRQVRAGRTAAQWQADSREMKRRYRANTNVFKAHVYVARAVRSGKLVKPRACSRCGEKGWVEGHHANGYARENWLRVEWLCRPCHTLSHQPRPTVLSGR